MLVLLKLQNQSFHIPFTAAAGPDLPMLWQCTPANARHLASSHGPLNQIPSLLYNLIVHAQSLGCVPFATPPLFFVTLYNPMNCSPPGSSVQGIFQARILECIVSGDPPDPGIKPTSLVSSALAGGFFTS